MRIRVEIDNSRQACHRTVSNLKRWLLGTHAGDRYYWGTSSETDHLELVGSWAKGTPVRPPRDVDFIFLLPIEVYHRFEQRTGNKQSQLLQEVKSALLDTYPQTIDPARCSLYAAYLTRGSWK